MIEQKRFEGHTQAKPLAILLARPMEQIPPETCNLVIQHQVYPRIAQIDAPLLVKGRRTTRACHLWQLGGQAVERKDGNMPVKMAWTEASVQPVMEINVLEAHCPAKLFSKLVGLLDQATKARVTRAEKGGNTFVPKTLLEGTGYRIDRICTSTSGTQRRGGATRVQSMVGTHVQLGLTWL